MSKVLVIGPDFFGYNESIANAFINNGWEADVINYFDGRSMTFSQLISSIFQKNYFFDIDKLQLNINYDLILVIKGTKISNEKIKELKKFTKKIYLWIMDPINLYLEIKEKLSLFDIVFTYQKKDIEFLKSYNQNVSYLPLFFDDKVFGINNTFKSIDFIFIGNLYAQRASELDQFCKSIINDEKKLNIQIYGGYGLLKIFDFIRIKRQFKYLSKFLKFGLVNPKKASKLYSNTKVGINIHPSSHTGLNMRFFELYGSGVVQILPNCNIELNEIDVNNSYVICSDLKMETLNTIFNKEVELLEEKQIIKHSSTYRTKEIINEFNNKH